MIQLTDYYYGLRTMMRAPLTPPPEEVVAVFIPVEPAEACGVSAPSIESCPNVSYLSIISDGGVNVAGVLPAKRATTIVLGKIVVTEGVESPSVPLTISIGEVMLTLL